MSASNATTIATVATTTNDASGNESPKLRLFVVMSPWHDNDSELGTFEEKVWALNEEDACREIAVRMAECEEGGCDPDEDVAEWVENHLDACEKLMEVLEVSCTVTDDISELIKGPSGQLDAAGKADYDAIMAILSKYTNPR